MPSTISRLSSLILGINRQEFIKLSDETLLKGKNYNYLTTQINNRNSKVFDVFRELLRFLNSSDLIRFLELNGIQQPNPAQPGKGILYFDAGAKRFRASEDGRDYFDAFPREGCRAYNTANISIANNTVTALTFDTERFDPYSMFALTGSQIVIVRTGRYNLGGVIEFDDAAGGYRELCVRLNGTTNLVATNKLPNGAGVANDKMNVACDYEFVAGDFIELTVFQNSGGALNVIATGNSSPEFWCCRIHDQPV